MDIQKEALVTKLNVRIDFLRRQVIQKQNEAAELNARIEELFSVLGKIEGDLD